MGVFHLDLSFLFVQINSVCNVVLKAELYSSVFEYSSPAGGLCKALSLTNQNFFFLVLILVFFKCFKENKMLTKQKEFSKMYNRTDI